MNKISKKTTVNNQTISLEIRGRNTETVWVFLHGWGSSKSVWQTTVKHLPHTSVTIDLPGFGRSENLSQPWDVDRYNKAVKATIENIGINRVVLVGHSFGGQIATSVAAEKPSWLSGLVLVNAAALRDSGPKLLSTLGRLVSPLFQLPGLRKLKAPLYNFIGADQPPKNGNLQKTMQAVIRQDQTDKLKNITVPVLVVWGKDDTVTPAEHARTIAEKIPQSTLVFLTGGHYAFVKNPESFTAYLQEFYNQQLS
jgi:pimeloyl-ACP methyl ester carboxylesterase